MVRLEHLISHRFRGFSKHENTLAGFKNALDFGVLNLEFDIRVALCGTPMIYHDEYAKDAKGRKHYIADVLAANFADLGGTFDRMPTAENLFKCASGHPNTDAKLLIDIKDAGFEEAIHALVCEQRLQDRVVYVSWIPNVLYRMHDLNPNIPLCLSHWCKNPNKAIRLLHKVHTSRDGHVPRLSDPYIHGERSGWYVEGGLKGALRDIIKTSGGSVCVPQNMVTADLVKDYHADNIEVSTFSYTRWKSINAHNDKFNIDLYFIDNKKVFDEL